MLADKGKDGRTVKHFVILVEYKSDLLLQLLIMGINVTLVFKYKYCSFDISAALQGLLVVTTSEGGGVWRKLFPDAWFLLEKFGNQYLTPPHPLITSLP